MKFFSIPGKVACNQYCFSRSLLLLLFVAGSLHGSDHTGSASSAGLTATEAVEIATRDNPDLAAMQARYNALSLVPSQAGSLPDPTINLNAMNFPTDTFSRSQEPMTQLQIGFSQTLPFPGKRGLRQQATEYDALVAGHGVAEGSLQLIRNVKLKWWQLYYLDRALDTVAYSKTLLRQFISVAKTKYEAGQGLQQDLLLSQLELSKLMDREIQLQALRRNQVIQLNLLMDRPATDELALPTKVSRRMPDLLDEDQLYLKAASIRPRLKQMETKIDAAQSRLDLAERNRYPDFKLGMYYGDRTGGRADFVSVMLGVKVPLYSGSKQSTAVSQKNLELIKNRHNSRSETGLVMASIATAITDYQRAKQQFSLFGTGIVPQAKQTVASMLVGYQVSEVDFLNLVRSQITLFNYELRYWKALSDARMALARLEAAVGEESIYE
ncbi:MAG: TolC family protein [Pseudomonadales bacterium]|nr:TolC family protein [Pseudomonadales bacterium]